MIGQDAVFDRPKQCRDDAEHQQRGHQHRNGGQRDADDRDGSGADLGEFQPAGNERLVEAVGDLAAQRRQEQERRHEHGAGQRDQRGGLIGSQCEEDQEHQRVLEEIVVESGQKLRPEERREAPRKHEMRVHGVVPFGGTTRRCSGDPRGFMRCSDRCDSRELVKVLYWVGNRRWSLVRSGAGEAGLCAPVSSGSDIYASL